MQGHADNGKCLENIYVNINKTLIKIFKAKENKPTLLNPVQVKVANRSMYVCLLCSFTNDK
jgi:hypothetical protein